MPEGLALLATLIPSDRPTPGVSAVQINHKANPFTLLNNP